MLLTEAKERFLNHLTSLERSPETIRGYRMVIEYLEDYFACKNNGPVYLDEITYHDLDQFISQMSTEKKWKINSVKRCHYALSSFFAYCYRKELCPKDISKHMEPVKGERKERVYLTEEEFEQLQRNIEHPVIWILAQTMFYSGMRITECLNLKVKDVDLNRGVFHVREAKDKTYRAVPIHEKLKSHLQTHLVNKDDEARVFATRKSGKVTGVHFNSELKKALRKTGLREDITAHCLRHSFASNLINKNRSLVHVQKLLGHADLRTTSVYTHAKLDDLTESVNTL